MLIAEIGLPQKDGYALCRYVRQEPEFQSLPVILLDHEFNAFNQRRAFAVGADVYLSQPLSADELIETVQSLLTSNASPDEDESDDVGDDARLRSAQTTHPQPVAKTADAPVVWPIFEEAAQAPPVSHRFDAEDAPPRLAPRRPSHLLFGAVTIAALLIAISLAILTRRAMPGKQAATDISSGALATTGQPVVTATEPEAQATTARAASLSEMTSSPDTSSATNPVNQQEASADARAAADTVDHTNAPGDAQTSEDQRDEPKPATANAARAETPTLGERQPSSKAIRPYAVRPAARANHWRRSGQEMVASGEHFGSGAKHIGKGSAQAARWAGRKASSGVKRLGSAIKRIF